MIASTSVSVTCHLVGTGESEVPGFKMRYSNVHPRQEPHPPAPSIIHHHNLERRLEPSRTNWRGLRERSHRVASSVAQWRRCSRRGVVRASACPVRCRRCRAVKMAASASRGPTTSASHRTRASRPMETCSTGATNRYPCRRPRKAPSATSPMGRTRLPADAGGQLLHGEALQPAGPGPRSWRLSVDGLVGRPKTRSLADIKARPAPGGFHARVLRQHWVAIFHRRHRQCAMGRRPAGRRCCEAAGVRETAPRSSSGELIAGRSRFATTPGSSAPAAPAASSRDGQGGLDLTITEQFARSMSVEDALSADNLLCYEMNGDALPPEHGVSGAADRPGLVRRGQRQVADAHRGRSTTAMRDASWRATTCRSARSNATATRCGRSRPWASTG